MKYEKLALRIAAALVLMSFLAVTSTAASLPLPGVGNFYKVDNQVYRGAQPSDEGFARIANLGIKTVIDLREIGEHSQAHERAVVTGLGMRYMSIPFQKRTEPSPELISKILGTLNDTSAGPVFLHCQRGADRTGAVIACYRISHQSWERDRALSEARTDGMRGSQHELQHYVLTTFPATALAAIQSAAQSSLAPVAGAASIAPIAPVRQ